MCLRVKKSMTTIHYTKIKLPLLILFMLFAGVAKSQPKIQGHITIDMSNGLIKSALTLSNLPNIEHYKILLNRGLNIKHFKNDQKQLIYYDGFYDGKIKGEALAYHLLNEQEQPIALPAQFNIEYTGAFPIYSDDFNFLDYKGLIAFNGKTMRASEQSKWYPVIYDEKNDKLIDSYAYDVAIEVTGEKVNSIFLNGSTPKRLHLAKLTSAKPFPLLLFVGDYNFIENNGDYIINTDISAETADKIFKNIEKIKTLLSKQLKTHYQEHIYLINHKAVNKRKKGSTWGFNTFPAFAFAGLDFNNLLTASGDFTADNFSFFGHEFGHNYFGANVMAGTLKWFWLESFAEYLSYQVLEELSSKAYLKQTLIAQLQSLKNKNFIPLAAVTEDKQVDESYRYKLAPLILKCFEDEFRKTSTNLVMQALLETAQSETLSIVAWKKAALKSGITEQQFDGFKQRFLVDPNFKKNVEKHITANYK